MLKLITGELVALGTSSFTDSGVTQYSDIRITDNNGQNHFLTHVVIHPECHSYISLGTTGTFLLLETARGRGHIMLATKVDGHVINEFDRAVASLRPFKLLYRIPFGVALFFAVLAILAGGREAFVFGLMGVIALGVSGIFWGLFKLGRVKFPAKPELEAALERLKTA